jgi:ABC-type multidrug transport system permease subunit
MRFVWLTAKKDLLLRIRDATALAIWFGIPLLLTVTMTVVLGGDGPSLHGTLLVVDQDDTLASRGMARAFNQGPLADIFDVDTVDLEMGRRRMDRGDASAMIVVPDGFQSDLLDGNATAVRLIRNPAQQYLPDMAEETLEILGQAVFYAQQIAGVELREARDGFLADDVLSLDEAEQLGDGIQALIRRLAPVIDDLPIELEIEDPAPDKEEGADFSFGLMFFPGMLFMALLFTAQGMSEDIWREKDDGTLRRVAASPQSVGAVLAGKAVAFLFLAAGVVAATLLMGVWAFDLPWRALPAAMVWSLAAGLMFFLLFTLIYLFASSRRTASTLASMVLFPLLMVGGSFFPLENMPPVMASIGRMTPNGWALAGFKAIIGESFGFADVAIGLALMAAISFVLFVTGSRRLKTAFIGS